MKRRKIDRPRLFTFLFLPLFTVFLFCILLRGNVIRILPETREDHSIKDSENERPIRTVTAEEWIEVSYREQKMYYFEDGELVFESDIVTGNESTEIIPYGIYHVLYMTEDATLIGEGYEKHVEYWIGFDKETGGHMIGFHDASWRTAFGGDIWITDPTLACINMPTEKVKQLYGSVEPGTEIRIHD